MTRPPPGVSFAQFFPNAPRVRAEAQSRTDRDKTRHMIDEVATSRACGSIHEDIADCLPRAQTNEASIVSQLHGDDDSAVSDMPSTVDSASSHASSSSSVFSSAAIRFPTSNAPRLPSHIPSISGPPSTTMTADLAATGTRVQNDIISSSRPTLDELPRVERDAARDSGISVKGRKCTYDPILDRLRHKSVSKTSKVTYKEFGLVCFTWYLSRGRKNRFTNQYLRVMIPHLKIRASRKAVA